MQRGVGLQGNVAAGCPTILVGHSEGRRLRRVTQVLLRGIQGQGQSPRGILGTGPAGAGVGPSSSGAELGKGDG